MPDEIIEVLECNAVIRLPGKAESDEHVRIMAKNDVTGKADIMFPGTDRVTMRIPYSMIVKEY
jgi:hypothetical protein